MVKLVAWAGQEYQKVKIHSAKFKCGQEMWVNTVHLPKKEHYYVCVTVNDLGQGLGLTNCLKTCKVGDAHSVPHSDQDYFAAWGRHLASLSPNSSACTAPCVRPHLPPEAQQQFVKCLVLLRGKVTKTVQSTLFLDVLEKSSSSESHSLRQQLS